MRFGLADYRKLTNTLRQAKIKSPRLNVGFHGKRPAFRRIWPRVIDSVLIMCDRNASANKIKQYVIIVSARVRFSGFIIYVFIIIVYTYLFVIIYQVSPRRKFISYCRWGLSLRLV